MSFANRPASTGSSVFYWLLKLCAALLAGIGAMAAIFATAIGAKAPPAHVFLLAFAPAILTGLLIIAADVSRARGRVTLGFRLMIAAVAVVPLAFILLQIVMP